MAWELLYLVGAALVGAVVTYVTRDFLKGAIGDPFDRIGRQFRSWIMPSGAKASDECMNIGYYKTSVFIIDGNGQATYTPSSIDARYTDGSPASPDDIADRIMLKDQEMERDRSGGNQKVWDGIGVGILDYTQLRTDDERHLGLRITFYKSRYAAFQATVVEIGSEDRDDPHSIYQMHLKDRDPRQVVPYLARSVGVVVVVVSSDNYVVATKRSDDVGARPGQYDASVVEGIEPTKDADISDDITRIDIHKSVIRGCNEELGYEPSREDVKILGFGVDMDFYQFNFFAVVLSSKTFEELQQSRNGKARDAWEAKLFPVPYTVEGLLDFIAERPMWDTAKVAFYWSLTFRYTRRIVEARAAQTLG